jgi:hypothetical protein
MDFLLNTHELSHDNFYQVNVKLSGGEQKSRIFKKRKNIKHSKQDQAPRLLAVRLK